MRVLLVGRAADRARLRPALSAAGFDIVAESEQEPDDRPAGIDAVILAEPADVRRSPGLPVDAGRTPLVEPLTPREREVLALVAEGLANKAIAHALGISDQTVKFHVAAIIAKLGATNRTDAVRRAVRRGLIAL